MEALEMASDAPEETSGGATDDASGPEAETPISSNTIKSADNKRSLTKGKRTSIFSSFLFTSKNDNYSSVDSEDGPPNKNKPEPETPRKLIRTLRMPPSPRSTVGFSDIFASLRTMNSDQIPTNQDSLPNTSQVEGTPSTPTTLSSDTLQSSQRNGESPSRVATTGRAMKMAQAFGAHIKMQPNITPDIGIPANDSSTTLKERQIVRRNQGTLVGTPVGTVHGLGQLGQNSMPLPLFRRSISYDEFAGLSSSYLQNEDNSNETGKYDSSVLERTRNQDSIAQSLKLDVTPDVSEVLKYMYTSTDVDRTASMALSTAPTSAATSLSPDSAISSDVEPILSTPISDDRVASSSGIISSDSVVQTPGIRDFRAIREQRKDKLFESLCPQDQMTLEELINAEALRRCRQVLIEIDGDAVFEKAMSQALRSQIRSQPEIGDTMAKRWEWRQEQTQLRKNAIRPLFLVREMLRGERSYIEHLENGIKVSILFLQVQVSL
ncbi:hypothetical protein QFC19_003079 [Naganishia cerealis]|uniref:Uncharacterized protein n=1 Tax=Naganishia cerealis TaxID=610337 RepID=A0ACC2W7C4_9TREE|nr:hypothetical protein QFC19_003079 [Naganishia cerealis]